MGFLVALVKTIFSRWTLIFVYFVVTVLTCVQAMFKSSFVVGGIALVASALCFFPAATFAASFLARREKNYSSKDLLGIGAIAVTLIVAGLALMYWSGFRIIFDNVDVEGPYWALAGIIIGLVGARKENAL